MIFLLFFMVSMFFSTLFADQRIRTPLVVDDLIAKNRVTGMQTFNVTASSGNTNISGSLGVTGVASLNSDLNVNGASSLSSTLTVSGASIIYDDFTVRADNGNRLFNVSKVDGATTIKTNAIIGGALGVSGDLAVNANKFNVAAASGNTAIAGALSVAGASTFVGSASIGGSLTVAGSGSVGGALNVAGVASLGSALIVVGNETVGGTLGVVGDVAINRNKFNVSAASGNTTVAGTLGVAGASILTGNTSLGGTLNVAGDATFNGVLHANGGIDTDGGRFVIADVSGNTTINGKLDITGSTSLDGVVVLQDDVMFGTKILTDASTSTTRDLLQITLPDIDNYIGMVDVTYIGDMANSSGIVSDLEIISAKYLISRMDKTLTATVARISESYYNITGGMSEPADTASIYAKSLGCDYSHAKSWVPNSRTIILRYLSPTQKLRKDINASVLYEIRSGGPAGGPGIGLSGLWAR